MSCLRLDHLALDNQLISSSLGRIIFELSSFVSKSLGKGEASELFSILIVMFTNVVLINLLFGLSCWQDFIDIASNINRIHKLIAQFLNL